MTDAKKKDMIENMKVFAMLILSGVSMVLMETCKHNSKATGQEKEPEVKAATNVAQQDTVASNARIHMVQNAKTR